MIHSFSAPTGCKSIKLVLTKPKLITLPIEAIIKIVFAIPDAKDLFAFLEALRPHIDLGPLDNLYSLSLAHEHEVFWPKLYLEPSILDSIDRSAFEALARHYPIVRVRNVWQDAAWLKSHLKPTAKITWDIENYPAVINIEDDWSNLRITRLKVAMVENLPFCWDIALSKLPLLTSLGVYKDCTDLGDLFKIMATSKQITEFSLLVDSYVIVDSDLIYLTEWFRHQQARKLEMWPNITKASHYNVRRHFYQAMFDCPSLDRLQLSYGNLDDIDFTQIKYTMTSFQLDYCLVQSHDVEALARRLEGSRVTELELNGYEDDDTRGMECFLQTLPRTSIKWLKLANCPIDENSSWSQLALLFEKCALETLILDVDKIPSEFAKNLATAIQHNQTICELNLEWAKITNDDLRTLIKSMTDPTRKVETMRIKVNGLRWLARDRTILKSMEDLAIERGGEFIADQF